MCKIVRNCGKVFRIGTVRYNWPMSAHASQAFSIAHCTDSGRFAKLRNTAAQYNPNPDPNPCPSHDPIIVRVRFVLCCVLFAFSHSIPSSLVVTEFESHISPLIHRSH